MTTKRLEVPMDQDTYARPRSPVTYGSHEADDTGSTAAVAAETARDTAKDEARNVAQTAKAEAGAVVDEATGQARKLASEARSQVRTRVQGQHNQLVDRLHKYADEIGEMSGDANSPV